jgi:hypothetical protein
MATTKIWDVRGWLGQVVHYVENPTKTGNPGFTEVDIQGLRDVMDYTTQDYKTEKQYYVSGVNCFPETARQQMMITKKRWAKEGGIVAFHAYQSFAPGEVTPELAHEIGLRLARELWGDQFEVIVATHLDKAHLHSHFVLNSVSFRDGKRYNDCKATYGLLRGTSDRLCREYGLSIIEKPQRGKRRSYDAWQAERAGKPTWWSIIRDDVDTAIKQSISMQGFIRRLHGLGYEIKPEKYLAIRPEGKERFVRLKTLGENYSEEAIKYRIFAQQRAEFPPERVQTVVKHARYKGGFKLMKPTIKGLQALYLYYLYLLRKAQRQPAQQVSFLLREDIRKMDDFSAQAKLLSKYRIETKEQLIGVISYLEKERDRLIAERKTIGYRKRRTTNAEKLEEYCQENKAITVIITKIRNDLKLAGGVLDRSEEVQKKLEKVKTARQQKEAISVEQRINFFVLDRC